MGEDPRAIRAQIDETRARMGDTVEALSYKTDVKARARDAVTGKKDAIVNRITGVKDAIVGTASDATGTVASAIGDTLPDPEQVKGQARRAASVAQENPLGLAVGAAALGFLAGMLMPSTRMEDERMGQLADQVKEGVKETVSTTAEQAMEHGRQLVEEVGQAAAETARESAPEHARELQATAQRKVEEAAGNTQEAGPS